MTSERLKHLAEVRISSVDKKTVEGDIPVRLCNYTDVYYNEHIVGTLDFMSATATAYEQRAFALRKGDVVLTKDSETAADIGVSALVAEEVPGLVCGYHLGIVRARPECVCGKYLRWVLSSKLAREQLSSSATGVTRFGLRTEAITDLRVPVPSLKRQAAISDYLDHEIAGIDRLISAKRRMITLLEQRRVAGAHGVVTGKQIAGARRDSGAPWLGGIPEHWKMVRLGSMFDVQLGRMLSPERSAGPHLKPYIRNINVRWGVVDTSDLAEMSFPPSERSRYSLRAGDLLVNEGGAGIGRAAIWEGDADEMYYQKSVHRVRPTGYLSARWLLEWFRVAVDGKVFQVEGNLATIPHLPADALRQYRVPCPPEDEVENLIARLDADVSRDGAIRDAVLAQVPLLEERRQALISAAVTGELDIPEAAG